MFSVIMSERRDVCEFEMDMFIGGQKYNNIVSFLFLFLACLRADTAVAGLGVCLINNTIDNRQGNGLQ